MEEISRGVNALAVYVLPPAVIMLIARRFLKVPDELFRKTLHCILLGAYVPLLFAFETWWISAGFAGLLLIFLCTLMTLAGRIPQFSSFVNERKKGEYRSSTILAMLMAMLSITVCWGLMGERMLVLACIYAWGIGDAFAALIGKRFGRHKIRLPFADPHKSWEGSAAMFAASVLSVMIVLLIRGGMGWGSCLFIALTAGTVTAFVEMCTKGGMDTITCPSAAMAVILPLVRLLQG